jgi:predicted DNA-binding transcriptional regulator AlpA
MDVGTAMHEPVKIDPVLPLPRVLEALSICRSSFYSLIKAGRFPKGLKLTARRRGWRESDVRTYLDSLERVQ